MPGRFGFGAAQLREKAGKADRSADKGYGQYRNGNRANQAAARGRWRPGRAIVGL
jgi:hypothetical protein